MSETRYPSIPILLVDDEVSWLRGMSLVLHREVGIDNCLVCNDSREVLGILDTLEVSVVLLDVTMPNLTGEELLGQIRERHPHLPVIMITGRNQADIAVRCMKQGAFDYFIKTTETERIVAGVMRAISLSHLREENRKLRKTIFAAGPEHPEFFAEFVTASPKMLSIFRYIEAIAGSPEPVLITGESGVGKELIARAVHGAGRSKGPWIAVNVAGLDENAFTDTLFGHVKGAFTGADKERGGMIEKARGGTLFLDEIGDLSLSCQTKLLRLLQEGEFYPLGSDHPRKSTARLLFATNRNLEEKEASGEFRRDLYYRLTAHRIEIPPLRERREDLPDLVTHFLAACAHDLKKPVPLCPPELISLLERYPFPGNVRELRGILHEAVSLCATESLPLQSILYKIDSTVVSSHFSSSVVNETDRIHFPKQLPTIKETVDQLVAEAMRRSSGKQTVAATLLGISRPALCKRLKKDDPSS